jgi:hypothetical protein
VQCLSFYDYPSRFTCAWEIKNPASGWQAGWRAIS